MGFIQFKGYVKSASFAIKEGTTRIVAVLSNCLLAGAIVPQATAENRMEPFPDAETEITYRKIDDNLRELLIESEKLVFKHTSRAAKISSNDYINDQHKVFGSLHDITGNAASQIQFHITDSTDHFIKGALYFNTKPNYDSLLPAVHHIKKDILHLMETLQWKK